MKRVAIVGGGVSGLSAAYFLARRGIPSTLFESRPRLGGLVRTDRAHGCLVEAGPDSWLAEKRWMRRLAEELGLGDRILGSNDGSRRTFVARKGRLVALPDSMRLLVPAKPWQVATTRLLGPAAKARMALEWFRRPVEREDRTVAEFVRDHFGGEAVEYLAQPMTAGVYGAPPENLSARRVLPRFVEYERRYGSVLRGAFRNRRPPAGPRFLTLRDGMASLTGALERRAAGLCQFERGRVLELRRAGSAWNLRLDGAARAADIVILAMPADEASRLVRSEDGTLADLLVGIPYSSSVVAALAYAEPDFGHPLDGFGFLVPRAEGGPVAACTWVGRKFDGRAAPGKVLLRAFLTGANAEGVMESEDAAVIRTVDGELRRWLAHRGSPEGGSVYRWRSAMPEYRVHHERLARSIDGRLEALPGLLLAGNAYEGLGIPDCVRRSERIAEAVAEAVTRGGAGRP